MRDVSEKIDWFVHQHRDFGVGNFINCTPTLMSLFDHYQQPIPVLFDRPEVRDMFLSCPFIRSITPEEAHGTPMLFSSQLCNQLIPDWLFIYRQLIGPPHIQSTRHTYVDLCHKPVEVESDNYGIVFRGCHASNHVDIKDPGEDIYVEILGQLKDKYDFVFAGTTIDQERGLLSVQPFFPNSLLLLDNMRKTLGALRHARFVITNDTGMYHAAAAIGVPSFVMWKDTNFNKNRAPGLSSFFSFKGNWSPDFRRWGRWTGILPDED